MQTIDIEFLNWPHPKLGVTPIQLEGGKPLVLKAKIKLPQRQPLSFDEIEDCFPDGGSAEENGILVSAQWLHDFAAAVQRAAHGIK